MGKAQCITLLLEEEDRASSCLPAVQKRGHAEEKHPVFFSQPIMMGMLDVTKGNKDKPDAGRINRKEL